MVANTAMGQKEAESLEKKLQNQYEHAWETTKKRRGLGLEYDPTNDPKNKTFYIDKGGSRSTKFEE